MASVTKRRWTKPDGSTGEGWQVRYVDAATGKRPGKMFDLKKDADAFKRKVEREIEDGVHVLASATQKVAAVVAAFLTDQSARLDEKRIGRSHFLRTEMVCKSRIVPAVGNLAIRDLTIDHVSKLYRDMVQSGLSPLTARHYLHVFRSVEQFARRRQWLKTQPVTDGLSDLRGLPSKPIHTFTADEVVLLLERVLDRSARGRHRFRGTATRDVVICLGALCGMRLGEILGLRRADIDLDRCVIHVRQNLTKYREVKGPKTRAGRRDVHIPTRAVEALRRWIDGFYLPNEGDLLLTTLSGKLIADANMRREWLLLLSYCGLPKRHFHALRHFHASWLLRHGMPVADVSKTLGHSSHDMTMRVYTHAMLNAPETAAKIESITALLPRYSPTVTHQ
ncbi:site-specific integrase [Sphingomonas sp. PsM26]|nr:site-specific integrase [Sphingomonas sp. PsM26]